MVIDPQMAVRVKDPGRDKAVKIFLPDDSI
jgi:hypothetical protein